MRVEDFAVGLVGLIGNAKAKNEAFNICGDNVYSWNDVIDVICSYLSVTPIYFDVTSDEYKHCYPSRKGEIAGRSLDAIIDNTKIKKIVPSFKTNYSLIEGVKKTLNAYKNFNFQKGIDWEFDAVCDRTIKKIAKKHKIPTAGMNLKFVDYLGNATLKNKIKYFVSLYEINCIMHIFRKLKSTVQYVFKHIKL
jgi:dTDP-D-glucose 4,6-dehydratase